MTHDEAKKWLEVMHLPVGEFVGVWSGDYAGLRKIDNVYVVLPSTLAALVTSEVEKALKAAEKKDPLGKLIYTHVSFMTALSYLNTGRKIRRNGWKTRDYIQRKNGKSQIYFQEGGIGTCLFTTSDIDANDWEIYE